MIWVALIVLLLIIGLLVVGYLVFNSVFNNKKAASTVADDDSIDSESDLMRPTNRRYMEYREPLIEKMNQLKFKELKIRSFDNLTLYGYLHRGNPDEIIVCVHGYRSSMQEDFADRIQIYLDRGSTILLLNDRAHGKSEGIYLGFSEHDKRDVERWIDLLNNIYDDPKIYLHGVSMGGATVIHCADMYLRNVKGIIDDCGFNSIEGITKYLMKDVYHMPYFPVGYLAWLWSIIITGISFNTTKGEECVNNTNIPILFIHGKEDHFVPCWMSENMYKNCVSPKELLLVDGCGHAAAYMMATEEYTAAVNRLLDGEFK